MQHSFCVVYFIARGKNSCQFVPKRYRLFPDFGRDFDAADGRDSEFWPTGGAKQTDSERKGGQERKGDQESIVQSTRRAVPAIDFCPRFRGAPATIFV